LTSDRFYIQKKQIKFPHAFLTGREHHHLSRVVRKKQGDKVHLFTENGENFTARIDKIEKAKTLLILLNKNQKKEPEVKIVLAPSLVKAKALELILQKSTELGMSCFAPVLTERSVVKISEKTEKKVNRWHRIAIEASKQCRRPSPPKIRKPLHLREFLKKNDADLKIFLDEKGGEYLKNFVMALDKDKEYKPTQSIILLLGPEGGWTYKEKQVITQYGYQAVSLGSNILRTETAAIACTFFISHFWNT